MNKCQQCCPHTKENLEFESNAKTTIKCQECGKVWSEGEMDKYRNFFNGIRPNSHQYLKDEPLNGFTVLC